VGFVAKEGQGGLPHLLIANDHAQAAVYLHGAHVTHFQPRGQKPVLWMSARSWFEAGKPIRGGVPICWPWFGPHAQKPDLPAHGLARLSDWRLRSARNEADGGTSVALALASSDRTKSLWPHDFSLEYTVRVGARLELSLRVENAGTAPFTYEEALHTYLAVSDIRKVAVRGLSGVACLDKVREMRRFTQGAEPLTFSDETDRVYLDTEAACEVDDPGLERRIRIEKSGSCSTVVWNPWVKKAQAMPDFGDDEWPGMLCIETANVAGNAVTLAPGATHEISARVEVRPAM
jgi:glucose-6-phosphate 1-epimerase